MKRVYVAGPISKGDIWANVRRGVEVGLQLLDFGFAVFIPQLSMYAEPDALAGSKRYEEWLDNDFSWIEVSDCVLRIPGESAGADREVAHAEKLGIPVFYSLEDLISLMCWAACD